jgi:hypothetical protein
MSAAGRLMLTVPVVVDNLPRATRLDLARCIYFVITNDGPSSDWYLTFDPPETIPFFMLGLRGIIYRPISADPNAEFTDPRFLERLIDAVEGHEEFSVETEYLWLPTGLLDQVWQAATQGEQGTPGLDRGSVFRVALPFFTQAFQTARDGTTFKDFASLALNQMVGERLSASLRYSPRETKALRQWSETQTRQSENFKR